MRKIFEIMRRYQELLYFGPILIMVAVFVAYPVIETFRLSFFTERLSGEQVFIGLKNYVELVRDPLFLQVLQQTAIWVILGIIAKIGGGLFLAMLLLPKFRLKSWALALILLPWAIPYIVSGLTWKWLFDTLYGHLNSALFSLGVIQDPVGWLTTTRLALLSVLVCHVWTGIPFCALTLLSGLYAIPVELNKAAIMDGANYWQIFRRITLPLLYPVIAILVVVTGIWGFNGFGFIYVMTKGGPIYSSEILVTNVYRYAFEFHRPGYASAIAVVGFAILFAATIGYVRLGRKFSLSGAGK